MKILIVTNMYPNSKDHFFGIFVKNQIDKIKNLNPAIKQDIFFIDGKQDKLNYLKSIFLLRNKLLNSNYDIIHAHYGYSGLVAGLANWKNIPLIITFHGSDINNRFQLLFSRCAAYFATLLIFVNKEFQKKITKISYVIPMGVDTRFFKPLDMDESKKRLHLDPNKKYILFPSSPSRKVKNYNLFYQIFSLVYEADNSVDSLLLENMSQKEVCYALNASHVVLMTSNTEGSPVIIKEAMSCNVPIISVNVGDVKKQINGVKYCQILDRDPQLISIEILKIIKSKERSDGRQKIINMELDSADIARKIMQIYNQVLY